MQRYRSIGRRFQIPQPEIRAKTKGFEGPRLGLVGAWVDDLEAVVFDLQAAAVIV
jgi:hypothetical protein